MYYIDQKGVSYMAGVAKSRLVFMLVAVVIAVLVAVGLLAANVVGSSDPAPPVSTVAPPSPRVNTPEPCPEGLSSDGMVEVRFGNLCMVLPQPWLYQSDLTTDVSESYTACGNEGCTLLSLYKAPLDSAEFVETYQDCTTAIAFKGDVELGDGNIPARYYEGADCGEEYQFFNRIWLLPGKGVAIVAQSPYPGNLNGVDKILDKYTGWRQ